MPTYEYRCTECGERTEAFQRMSDKPLTMCPACKREALQRLVSGGAGVLYKGEGWYVTDYSKKSSGGKEATAASRPAESGADTASGTTTPSTDSGSSDASPSPSLAKTGT